MCLSTVYKNTKTEETVVMRNVMSIECKDGCVILTDLMERTVAIEGELVSANLVDGYVIVKENLENSLVPPGVFVYSKHNNKQYFQKFKNISKYTS